MILVTFSEEPVTNTFYSLLSLKVSIKIGPLKLLIIFPNNQPSNYNRSEDDHRVNILIVQLFFSYGND